MIWLLWALNIMTYDNIDIIAHPCHTHICTHGAACGHGHQGPMWEEKQPSNFYEFTSAVKRLVESINFDNIMHTERSQKRLFHCKFALLFSRGYTQWLLLKNYCFFCRKAAASTSINYLINTHEQKNDPSIQLYLSVCILRPTTLTSLFIGMSAVSQGEDPVKPIGRFIPMLQSSSRVVVQL